MKIFYRVFIVFGLFAASNSFAEDGARSIRRLGISVGIFTEPFPSFWGFSFNYNLRDFLRLSIGYGNISYSDATLNISATGIGGDLKVFIPKTRVSPFASVGYTTLSGTRAGTGQISTLGNIAPPESVVTFGGGLDFQAASGFNLGLELKASSGDHRFVTGGYVGYYF